MKKVSQKAMCERYLDERLADGPVEWRTIRKEAAALHLSETAMRHAAKTLDVHSVAVMGEFGRITMWALPEHLSPEQRAAAR